jgi:hypothetical protein
MQAFRCGPVIPPNAPPAASGMRAVARGRSPIRLPKMPMPSAGSNPG